MSVFEKLLAPIPECGARPLTVGRNEVSVHLPDVFCRPALSAALRAGGCRHVAVFAEDRTPEEGRFYLYDALEHREERRYLLLRYPILAGDAAFPALSAFVPALNWMEREVQDWYGLEAVDHPNPRRVAIHDNWPQVHPLRKGFRIDTVLPPFEGEQHTYRPTVGEGVFYIPVGPVHAGIIEPGHFNFAVAGEPILYLQLRMFYTHKGTEKRFEQMPAAHAVYLAESVSGDASFAHGLAYCQALESAASVEIPAYAATGRLMLLECERIYNHVADIGAIATDVGFVIANAHASRLKELLLRMNEAVCGSRLLRGVVCPGGLRRALETKPLDWLDEFERDFEELVALIEGSDSTLDRLERTGTLAAETARDLGIVGPAGRASGQDVDVRRDHPFADYAGASFAVPVFTEGDVLRRMRVRVAEVRQSLWLIRDAAARLQEGPAAVSMPPIEEDRTALSAVEGWRGEILYWIRTGPGQTLSRCKVKDPSINNWPAIVEAVQGDIVPDFPVINKSFNLSYSGTDR